MEKSGGEELGREAGMGLNLTGVQRDFNSGSPKTSSRCLTFEECGMQAFLGVVGNVGILSIFLVSLFPRNLGFFILIFCLWFS